jgi:PAS domain S-box-containing protein
MGVAPEPADRTQGAPADGSAGSAEAGVSHDHLQPQVDKGQAHESIIKRTWTARLMRVAPSLVVVFEIGYLLQDLHSASPFRSTALAFHLLGIFAACIFLILTATAWFSRHWRGASFGLCSALIVSTTGIALFSAASEWLFITAILTVFGGASLLPWSRRWQGWLTIIAAAALAAGNIFALTPPVHPGPYWIGFLAAASLAYLITVMSERYRTKLSAHVNALHDAHHRILEEIAYSSKITEERNLGRRKELETEAKLRKIFDASADIITVTRLSDGALIDFNDAFLSTGHARGAALGATTLSLGLWANQKERREFLDNVKKHGIVRNMRASFRKKDGSVAASLISSTLVELNGQPCAVSIIRDVTELEQAGRELVATREELSARIEALRESEDHLRTEMAERELAQKRLAEREAMLQKIFEATSDGVAINRLADGRFIEVNKGWEASGYTREETIGKTAEELAIFARPERVHEFFGRLRSRGSVRNVEADLRMKDGRIVPHLVSARVVELGGEPCVISVTQDITRLKKTEQELVAAQQALSLQVQALRENQERLHTGMAEHELAKKKLQESEATLRKIFEASLDSIAINRLDDGRFIDVNREFVRTRGYTKDEILGRTPSELRMWADPNEFKEFVHALRSRGLVRNMEAGFRAKDGTVSVEQISGAVVEIDGESCTVSVSRDLSAVRKTEQELIETREAALAASQAKSEFLSSMSHEIRAPMNAILGMADVLWETSLSFEQRRYLETMRTNGSQLLNLINGILDLARIESGRFTLEAEPFDLNELVERVIETLGIKAHEKGLELVSRISPDVPSGLVGDPLRLRQILINLLSNAIKFTEQGEVMLTVEIAPRQRALHFPVATVRGAAGENGHLGNDSGDEALLCFSVRDTGIGIPHDRLDAIFSSFTQADPAVARKYGGSGLGLAIVKRLVELMKGKISVESKPGNGAIFYAVLPFGLDQRAEATVLPLSMPAAPRSGAINGVSSSKPAAPDLAGVRILVVDDSPANRLVLREMLSAQKAEVTECDGGSRALDEIRAAAGAGLPYKVVLLDRRMPGTDGIELARRIIGQGTEHESGCDLVIVMLTSDDLNPGVARIREAGLGSNRRCRYLVKPLRRSDVFQTITAALSGQPEVDGKLPAASAGFEAPAAAAVTKPLRILLAEDSADNRLLIEAYLRKTPYSLDYAEDGKVAIDKFVYGKYDLVLMDLQMPVIDGYAAAEAIRRWEHEHGVPRTPILALTASALDDAVRKSLACGCDAHLAKPVKKAALLHAIRLAVTGSDGEDSPTRATPPANGTTGNHGTGLAAPRNKVIVEVSSDLSDLIPVFLEHKRTDSEAILAAVDRCDYDTFAKLAHRLKGEGGSYGLFALTEIGSALEQAAKGKNIEDARSLAELLSSYLDRLEVVYAD